jgi:glycerol kinase
MRMSSRNSNSSSRSTIRIPGASSRRFRVASPLIAAPTRRWHEHDPEELQASCEQCIDDAVVKLEEAGWTRDSIRVIGITNQRETTVAWSRKTGRSLCKAIVWDDARTKNTVAHFDSTLANTGIELADGSVKKGAEGVSALREL